LVVTKAFTIDIVHISAKRLPEVKKKLKIC